MPPAGWAIVRLASCVLLLVSLVAVVGLAKILSPDIEHMLAKIGAPKSAIGVAIALLVLLPEGFAAMRAALADRLQSSFNLALGSALASIGLTIPVVAMVSIVFDLRIESGHRALRTRDAHADARGEHFDARARPHNPAAGGRTSRDFRGVYLSDDSALVRPARGRYIFSGKRTMKPSRFGIRTFGNVSAFIVASSAISLFSANM